MWILLCCVLLLSGCVPSREAQADSKTGFVLVDPGHGGFDGGAVAEDGTTEKHINLAVSLLLRDILTISGVSVRMTRETDIGLQDAEFETVRQKKISDMKNRLTLYNQASTVIAVHQNHFSIPKYSGTQVFYSVNHPDSILIAGCVQDAVREQLQLQNDREIKPATDGIYLLHHTTAPAVLVECGFLSNPQEREQLLDEQYRQQLAFCIAVGYFRFYMQK